MAQLRTDYKDEILDVSANTQRKYRMINNDDGTVSFVDETVYFQNGDVFGAAELNEISRQLLGGGSKIRYNEETDTIEVLFGGEWTAWKKANMKWDGHIFYNGNIFEDITGGYKLLNSALNFHTLSIGTELVFARTGGYGNTNFGEATVYTANKIDVTDFTKMRVTGTVYSSQTNGQGYVCTMGLSSIQDKANVCSFDVKATGDNNVGVAFDEIIDITSYNAEYYFTMYNTNMALGGVKISSIQFYN